MSQLFLPVHTPIAPRVLTVENAGLLFTDNQAGVSGTDAGYSISLEKETLWLFGDVFLLDPKAPEKNYAGAISNCGLLVPRSGGRDALRRARFLTDSRGVARQLIDSDTLKDKDLRFWPFGGWYDPAGKRIYLFYGRVRVTGQGPLAFHAEGYGLTASDARTPEALRFRSVGAEIWWPIEPGRPVFGSAVLEAGDYLYVAGFEQRSGRKYGKLARVLKSRVGELAAYEYYAGGTPPRWSNSIEQAADVEGLDDFPSELSIAYSRYLGGYLAVHSVGLGGKARLSLAPDPWGPYKRIGEIGTPRRALSQGFTYAAKEHPELAEAGGRVVYVTYVDSSRYWLQMLKVTLAK